MIDAHTHSLNGKASRSFVAASDIPSWSAVADAALAGAVAFYGIHPWFADSWCERMGVELARALSADPSAGVGEIGLDRLRTKEIPEIQRLAFISQLRIAAGFGRPAVLHGAKCWGETVKAASQFKGRIPAFLFHGFSRSEGLLEEIYSIGGYVSVGPQILNDHAVNLRDMVSRLRLDRVLVETDGADIDILDVARKVAELKGVPDSEFEGIVDSNAARFAEGRT